MRTSRMLSSVALVSLSVCLACGGFDKQAAALQIEERFCSDWAYGCTDSTRVRVRKVHETPHGRSVEFEIIDRADRTARLSAAYFEPVGSEGEDWELLLFENPFLTEYKLRVSQLREDQTRVSDRLMELRTAQNWHSSIYGRYANDLGQLTKVNYKPVDEPIRLFVTQDGTAWRAESDGRYVTCSVGAETLLPECVVHESPIAGSEEGPLAAEFGAD